MARKGPDRKQEKGFKEKYDFIPLRNPPCGTFDIIAACHDTKSEKMYFFVNGSDDYFLFRCTYRSTYGSLRYPLGYLCVKNSENGTCYVVTNDQDEDLYSEHVSSDRYLPEGAPEIPEQAYVLDFIRTGYLAMGDRYRLLHLIELDSESPPDVWLIFESPSGGSILTVIPGEA
ncbi:MAG: hypothetical protein HGA33_01625, partial [Candidatus Moranbacteria bacterium]|nr:hypothetical protein [Candidatus Moranbacteria bacterium]